MKRASWVAAAAAVAVLSGCGPEAREVPEDWYLAEWFVWDDSCGPDSLECTPEILVQLEIDDTGNGVIHREAHCFPEIRAPVIWEAEAPGVLRFEPVEEGTNGLQQTDFESFQLEYTNDCTAAAEEHGDEIQLRRGPVSLVPSVDGDCDGTVTADPGSQYAECLEPQ